MKETPTKEEHTARSITWTIAVTSLLLTTLPLPAPSQIASRLVEHVSDGFTGLCLLQDERGFIWCGTNRGLFCYDGYTVEYLHHDESDRATLSDDQVNALALGDDGQIWVGTPAGLDRFNPVTRTFRRFPLPRSGPEGNIQVYVTSLVVDSGGVLWVGTQEQGLFEVTITQRAGRDTLIGRQHRHRGDDPGSLSHDHVHSLWSDSRTRGGFVLVGTSSGLNRLQKATGVCERYFHDPSDRGSIPHDEVWAIVGGDSGDVWMGTGAGVCRFRRGDGGRARFERLPVAFEAHVFTLVCDHEGYLWVGTHESTIVRYHIQTGRSYRQSLEQAFAGRRYSNAIYSSLCDREGAVWFAVHYGLERYDPAHKPFQFVPLSPPPDRWLLETTGFCEDAGGDLWIATDTRGVFRCRARTGDTVNYVHRVTDPRSLCWNEVNALVKDRRDAIWIGTMNGLDRYDPATDSFHHISFDASEARGPRSLPGRCVYNLLEDRQGSLWVATNGGLSKLDPSTMTFTHYLEHGEMAQLGFYIGALVQPESWRDGSLLLGSKGLYRFDPSSGTMTLYRHGDGPPESHIDQMIFCLAEDRQGNIWASTYSGVYLLKADGSFRHLTAPGQLPSDLACQIVEDQEGRVWLSTAGSGVARYDTLTSAFRGLEVREGFLRNSFNIRGSFRSRDGTIYVGAANGFLSFHPSRIRDNPLVPPVRITGMQVFDRPIIVERPFEEAPELVLAHTEKMVTFNFVGLCYSDPGKTRYAYMLEGLSQEWLQCGTQRTATFTNLDPGSYVFRVKASNSDGVWNEEGASFRFVIDPPFYQTWYFRGLVAVLLGLMVYGAYRYRIAKILAMERLRLRIANDLHDDIGSDLSGLALESDLLARRLPEGDPARERLHSVGRTIRSAADNLRDVVWIVSPDQDKVQDLVERMREVASKMLTGIGYEFHCTPSDLSVPLDIEFKRHVLMMFKEILHNVVRHARASAVDVTFHLGEKRLRLCVQDDGVGFDPSGKHGGRGLRSLQARASAIGGKVSIESEAGKGTVVSLEADITRL